MKTPRVSDFYPDAKIPPLKSSLDHMPSIQKPKPLLLERIAGAKREANQPTPERPGTKKPLPPPVRGPVPLGVPLIPKVKRLIRQRQPFDIYEDQYVRLKSIANAEKGYINGRGMSQMVREAIDNYLRDHTSPKEK
jgi:hypothetical protein